LGDRFTVHQGRAICAVCGAEVGLNVTGVAAVHANGKIPADEVSKSPSQQPPKRSDRSVARVPPVGDVLDPTNLEDLRHWIDMLPPGEPAILDRDRALRIVEELQRLQRHERELRSLLTDMDDR
jgi:uncharacterized Zn finger protein (UPF0148 family)